MSQIPSDAAPSGYIPIGVGWPIRLSKELSLAGVAGSFPHGYFRALPRAARSHSASLGRRRRWPFEEQPLAVGGRLIPVTGRLGLMDCSSHSPGSLNNAKPPCVHHSGLE